MTAALIFDIAPLGSLVAYSDGQPKPPARFTKKLAAWKSRNGVGRLVRKTPSRERPTYTTQPSITLHEGDFGGEGIILITVMRSYGIDSDLTFRVIERPKIARSASCRMSAKTWSCCISPRAARRPNSGLRRKATAAPDLKRSRPTRLAPMRSRVAPPHDPRNPSTWPVVFRRRAIFVSGEHHGYSRSRPNEFQHPAPRRR